VPGASEGDRLPGCSLVAGASALAGPAQDGQPPLIHIFTDLAAGESRGQELFRA